ncbi:hypothetical protein ACFWHL_16200 [Streptomyces massasporeus]
MPAETDPIRTVMTDQEAAVEADRIIANFVTSYRDHTAVPKIGDAPHVPQPDSRIVPQWALGLAVGSIGVGTGAIGLGCATWLVCKGLSSVIHSLSAVTLAGVLTVAIPFAGLATVVTAIGGAISKAKKATAPKVHNHYEGPVHQDQRNIQNKNNALWVKNTNEQ